jgi:inosose dehydratase
MVEQDLYPCDPDEPLPIATRTCKYLRQLGVGSEAV